MRTPLNKEALGGALQSAGLRLTPQRLAVLETLVDDETHPTALELYERLKPHFPTMSVATVYNTLGALESIGQCKELDLGGPSRFDPNVTPHDHAVCGQCGAIRDVGRPTQSDRPQADRPQVPGFQVERVERIYRGICASCADAARNRAANKP